MSHPPPFRHQLYSNVPPSLQSPPTDGMPVNNGAFHRPAHALREGDPSQQQRYRPYGIHPLPAASYAHSPPQNALSYHHPHHVVGGHVTSSPSQPPSTKMNGLPTMTQYPGSTATTASSSAAPVEMTASASSDGARVRAYRSRKDRPCDHCRKRKSRCIIEVAGQDCQSCRSNGRSCTFQMSPTPRSRPIKNEDGVTISSVIVPRKRTETQATEKESAESPSQTAAGRRQSTVEPDSEYFSPLQRRGTASSVTSTPSQQSEWKKPGNGTKGLSSSPQFVEMEEHSPSRSPPRKQRRTTATAEQLYGLVSNLTHDSEPDAERCDCKSDADDENRALDREPHHHDHYRHRNEMDEQGNIAHPGNGESEEEKGMIAVALGSSSSEDPHLLRKAGSDAGSMRHRSGQSNTMRNSLLDGGMVVSPSNDHMSSSSKTTMPPPPTPEAQTPTQSSFTGLRPLQVRQVTSDPSHPIFFAYVPACPYGRKGPVREIGSKGLAKVMEEVRDKIGQLMVLYAQRDSAAFPLLMDSQRHKFRQAATDALVRPLEAKVPLPAVLALAALATATVYDVSLRPISKMAWGHNLHALIEQFEVSTLTTVQAALTDLTGRPSINASGNFMTFNQTLAIGHMLGLHLDPTGWKIAREEKDLRIRLWWAIVIHDKWSSLCWGRPSTIHHQGYSTPLPKNSKLSLCRDHLEDSDLASFPFGTGLPVSDGAHTPGDTFAALCRLTLILGDILNDFHGVRTVDRIQRDAFSVAQKIKMYFVELEDWIELMPGTLRCVLKNEDVDAARGAQSVPGTRSLQLSYLAVNLLLCRALLDSAGMRSANDRERLLSAHQACLHGATMMVEFLESLSKEDYGGFYLHYGSHHLASCLSLLARLCFGYSELGKEEQLFSGVQMMVRLLVALSKAHSTNTWDLAELALTRSGVILRNLASRVPEFPRLFSSAMCADDDGNGNALPNWCPVFSDGGNANSANHSDPHGQAEGSGSYSTESQAHKQGPSHPGHLGKTSSGSKNAASPIAYHVNNAVTERRDQQGGSSSRVGGTSIQNSSLDAQRQAGTTIHSRSAPVHRQGTASQMYFQSQEFGTSSTPSAFNHIPAASSNEAGDAMIPQDMVGLPSFFSNTYFNNNANTVADPDDRMLTASHLLSSMEVDWLGLPTLPNTFTEFALTTSSSTNAGNV